jgi:hypothetical protein
MAIMSDEETFLTRWSKRKAEARSGETPTDIPKPAQPLDVVRASGMEASEADEVPLEDLPPIESIDASTDLRPWLQKKVPEAWKRAALGRVWASDPAISEFVGLADYAWDWNVPDGVPGFGPLRASDNIAELLLQAIGQAPPPKPKEEIPQKSAAIAETENEALSPADEQPVELPKISSESDPELAEPSAETYASDPAGGNSFAEPDQPIRRRRGGGALPS